MNNISRAVSNRRSRRIAIGTLVVSLSAIALFVAASRCHFGIGRTIVGTLGATTAMLWCPALTYVGIRTRSALTTTCGAIGVVTTVYWLWTMIYCT